MSLSDKRKELYMKLCSSEGINKVLPLASIFAQIEKQDKEAVKKLEEYMLSKKFSGGIVALKEIFGDTLLGINKLCGDGK